DGSLELLVGAGRRHTPPGDTLDVGELLEAGVVAAAGAHEDLVWLAGDRLGGVGARVLRHRDDTRELAAHARLHAKEPVPAAERHSAPRRAGMRKLEVAVDGD